MDVEACLQNNAVTGRGPQKCTERLCCAVDQGSKGREPAPLHSGAEGAPQHRPMRGGGVRHGRILPGKFRR